MSKSIITIGDSITEGSDDPVNGGWAGNLIKWYESLAQGNKVINLGIGGNTTDDILQRIEKDCSPYNPDIIIVAIGVNDSRYVSPDNDTGTVPLKKFSRNLRKILQIAGKISETVVSVGMVPVDESRTTPIAEINYYTKKSQYKYDRVINEIVKELNIPYIDLFNKWLAMGKEKYAPLLSDGLHPDTAGHMLMFEQVKEFLLEEKLV